MSSDQIRRRHFVVTGETRDLCVQFSEDRLAAHQLRNEYAKMIGGLAVWGTDRKIVGLEWPDGKPIPDEWKKRDEFFDKHRIIVPDTRTKKGREIAEHFEVFAVVPDAADFTQRLGRNPVISGNRMFYAGYRFCGGLCVVQVPEEEAETANSGELFSDGAEIPTWMFGLLTDHAPQVDSGSSWKETVDAAIDALRALQESLNYNAPVPQGQ
jgi:hypothetical protein